MQQFNVNYDILTSQGIRLLSRVKYKLIITKLYNCINDTFYNMELQVNFINNGDEIELKLRIL